MQKVMDLGCGTGRHTIYLAQNGYQVFAVDISETGIEVTRAKAEKLNLTNIEFAQLDMRNLSVDDNLMDAIMCVWTSGHGTFEDARKNLKEMYRFLGWAKFWLLIMFREKMRTMAKGRKLRRIHSSITLKVKKTFLIIILPKKRLKNCIRTSQMSI